RPRSERGKPRDPSSRPRGKTRSPKRKPMRWRNTSAASATSSSTVPAGMATTDDRTGRIRSALESVLPRTRFADQRDILGGAGQNVIGLAAGVLATFATQIVMTRVLGKDLFGVV